MSFQFGAAILKISKYLNKFDFFKSEKNQEALHCLAKKMNSERNIDRPTVKEAYKKYSKIIKSEVRKK